MTDLIREHGYSQEDISALNQKPRDEESSTTLPVRKPLAERIAWELTKIIGGGKRSAPQAEIRTIGPKGDRLSEIVPIPDSSRKIIQFPGNDDSAA